MPAGGGGGFALVRVYSRESGVPPPHPGPISIVYTTSVIGTIPATTTITTTTTATTTTTTTTTT